MHGATLGKGRKDVVKAMARGGSRDLDALALGNSEGTGGKYLTAPVMMVGSFEELEKGKKRPKGRSFSLIISSGMNWFKLSRPIVMR